MASYCDAKSKSGLWVLRVDDIDGPRSAPGSADTIQRTLEQYGFRWDGPVQWQSERLERYQNAVSELVNRQLIFNCGCSRRSLLAGKIYPGNCRNNTVAIKPPPADYHREDHALRCALAGHLEFTDAIQGVQNIVLEKNVGDIIIWRRDNLVAYALACAIDDAENVSHVVRGADLLGNTAAQVAIMQALDLPVPEYAHIPVAINANGDKLSKHTKAQPISSMPPLTTLLMAWQILGQADLQPISIADFWKQAITHWQIPCVPSVQRLSI
jgi:glutamyl-Q tRNA(Asp) synthetase